MIKGGMPAVSGIRVEHRICDVQTEPWSSLTSALPKLTASWLKWLNETYLLVWCCHVLPVKPP